MKKEKPLNTPLNIIGFDDREQVHPNDVHLPEWMPKHEFFMLIVAPAGCGKTTLILNLLLRIYMNYFHEVKVFSPTIHNDQKWTHLTSTKNVLRKNPYKKLFEKVKQKEVVKEKEEPSTPNEKPLTPDEFYFENFQGPQKRGKKGGTTKKSSRLLGSRGSLKKMGKEYLEYWKQQNPAEQALLKDPNEIMERGLRLQKLSAIITKPTPPLLAQQCRQFNTMLGLGSSSSSFKSQGFNDGGSNGGYSQIGITTGFRSNPLFGGRQPATAVSNGTRRRIVWNRGTDQGNGQGNQGGKENDQQNTHEEENPDSIVGTHDTGTKSKKKKKEVKGAVKKESMFEEYSEETLQTIMDNQDTIVRHLSEQGKDMTMADHMCLVFDDMVGSGLFNAKRNNAFKRLTVRRRHFCSSVIGVVQAYKEFPKTSRNNTNIYVLFKIDSDEEIMGIYKDFPCGLRPDVWRRVYDYCTKEPYSFMMINLQVKDPQYRIVKNFNEPLNVPVYERELQENWAFGLGLGAPLFPEGADPGKTEKREKPFLKEKPEKSEKTKVY